MNSAFSAFVSSTYCSISKVFYNVFYSAVFSCFFLLLLFVGQSSLPHSSVFSNAAMAEKIASPYKKSFTRSKRINTKKSKKRRSSGSCILWDAKKINSKAAKFKPYINQYSRKYRIDRNLIKAVITAESCFRVKALSHAGAQGLMQLIPDTAKRFGVSNSYMPQQNIMGGTKYLRFLMDRFKGNLKKVIASYNAGEGAVDRYKGIPPYKETIQYVKNVMYVYSTLKPPPPPAPVVVNKVKKVKKIKVAYKPPMKGKKAGRQGWQYNRSIAPHLYKQ